ncbi:hypothetical protein, conserved [Babesia ovata]|uniref:Extracellular matrix-binding ebh n=1 Tax=Babesia ovata TaxID=189622 RepID=A0A2H6KK38_9APIC|nr:uncharacterized protein BOVATA_048450 [Babesia ovata]GBE63352.1 hypothetical protein, conserved [Babesia ovata]
MQVNNELATLLKATADKAIGQLQNAVNGTVVPTLNTVKQAVPHLESSAKEARLTLIKHSGTVTEKFAALCKAVKDIADNSSSNESLKGLKQILTDFQTVMLKGGKSEQLQKIVNDLSELMGRTLVNAIETADTFITTDAFAISAPIIDSLHAHVNQEVKDATEKITTQARRQYVTSIISLLTEFANQTNWELKDLPQEIEDDKHIGVKGFMEKLESEFILEVQQIDAIDTVVRPNENSPLSKGAKFLNNAFTALFDKLRKQTDFSPNYDKLWPSKEALTKLLSGLVTSQHFNHDFRVNLQTLKNRLGELVPQKFGDGDCPLLLNALTKGLPDIVTQLGHAYVNKYSGEDWKKNHADKYANIMLTSTSTLYEELYHLFYSCHKDWSKLKIDGSEKVTKNKGDFEKYLESQGYNTVNLINKNHTGQEVAEKLKTAFSNYDDFDTPSDLRYSDVGTYLNSIRREWGPMSLLYRHLATYYSVCHTRIPTAPKSPCSIRDMLGWMCGLRTLQSIRALRHIVTQCSTRK